MVRKDWLTSIETSGMVGAKYVEVAQGTAKAPECPQRGTLPSKQANGMEQLMKQGTEIANDVQATIRDLHKNADQTLQSFNDTAGHVDGVVVAVRGNVEQIASIQRMLVRMSAILLRACGRGEESPASYWRSNRRLRFQNDHGKCKGHKCECATGFQQRRRNCHGF